MQHFLIPMCYFPSTVLVLDSETHFLSKVFEQYHESLAYRLFETVDNALAYIQYQAFMFSYGKSKPKRIKEFAAVYAEIYNPSRFSEISVVVLEKNRMDGDGLMFLDQIRHGPIKKLLLIDAGDEALAKKALKDGLIHAYLLKDHKRLKSLLQETIHALQLAYFQEVSAVIERILPINPPKCLYDKDFAHLFQAIKKQHHIVEYYLFDAVGRFLLLDKNAELSFLMVEAETEKSGFQTAHTYVEGNAKVKLRQKKIFAYQRYLDELEAEALLS